jgi:hypothetical protein
MHSIWFAGRHDAQWPLEEQDLRVFPNFADAYAFALEEAQRTDTIWVVVRAESFTLH